MKRKTMALVAGLLALASTPTWAGDFYVLASGGMSHIDADKARFDADIVNAGLTLNSSSLDKDDTGYKLQVGYRYNPYFAIEGGYVDLGRADYSAGLLGGTGVGNVKATGWNAAVLGIWPVASGFEVFGKLGMMDSKLHMRLNAIGTGGTVNKDVTAHEWRTNLGLGGTYQVTQNWGVRMEWEQFYNLGDTNTTGEADVSLLSLGLSYRF